MPHARFTGDEIADRGEEIYEETLRTRVEIEENIGKIISIDIECGDFEVGDNGVLTARALVSKNPDAAIYGKRIGYNAVFALGGSLVRTAK